MNSVPTESEVAALDYLARAGETRLSLIGFEILEKVPQGGHRKPNPSPQGAALFASRFVRQLIRRGFVGHALNGYKITPAGRDYLKGLKA